VITNFTESGRTVRRVSGSGIRGAGPRVAAQYFRSYAFVSGIVLEGEEARALATAKWDGSEMYQMYLGSRIVAAGGPLLVLDLAAVEKDIQIAGEEVDSFARKPKVDPCPIIERRLTLDRIGHLVIDAIDPYLSPSDRDAIAEQVLRQVFLYTYPFWIFEYRRVQSWRFAAGICLGMRPKNVVDERLTLLRKLRLALLYGAVTFSGLTLPLGVFYDAYPWLHRLAKRRM
jgi:hypothetical protein